MRAHILQLTLYIGLMGFGQSELSLQTKVASGIQELKSFIAIPNDALNPSDIEDNIFWLEAAFEKRGFNTAILETSNLPLFFAALPMDDDKPTLLFYMHFDGQSVDPAHWDQENPYEVVLKKSDDTGYTLLPWETLQKEINPEWRLFGRSTADDKGPIVMMLQALDLLKEDNVDLPYNVKVILDSEEEKGSKPLAEAVLQYKELLQADYLLIHDGPLHPSELPTVIYGCRGITTLTLTTFGPIKPQHSGHYGNYAPNPGMQLAQLLASMKNERGQVTIDGFYQGIDLNKELKEKLARVPDEEEEIKARLQFKTADQVGSNYQESLQYPSLNIRGLSSGWTGPEARTIVPATATAEIDLRLVPESDGKRLKELVKKHAIEQGFTVLDHSPSKEERMSFDKIVEVQERKVTDAFRTDMNHPFGQKIVRKLNEAFGKKVVEIRIMGGTVPISTFIKALDIPAFIIPMVNADNNQHSPNENLKVGQMAYGIKAFYQLLSTE